MLIYFFIKFFFLAYPLGENWVDIAFADLTSFLEEFGRAFGMSYHGSAVLLVCVVAPVLLIYYMLLAWLNCRYQKKNLNRLTWISILVTVVLFVSVLSIIAMNVSFEQIAVQPPHDI